MVVQLLPYPHQRFQYHFNYPLCSPEERCPLRVDKGMPIVNGYPQAAIGRVPNAKKTRFQQNIWSSHRLKWGRPKRNLCMKI